MDYDLTQVAMAVLRHEAVMSTGHQADHRQRQFHRRARVGWFGGWLCLVVGASCVIRRGCGRGDALIAAKTYRYATE